MRRLPVYALAFLICMFFGAAFPGSAADVADFPGADSLHSSETGRQPVKAKFVYDVNFEMDFDNREYDASDYAPSGTIFGARLTPSAGVAVGQSGGMLHKVMLGIDIMKDFGRSPISPGLTMSGGETAETSRSLDNWALFREMLLYYRMSCNMGKTNFSLTTGVFPKSLSAADYPVTFFSDSVRFYDNNYEGLLLAFGRTKSYYEVGCDWMGKYGTDRRERFMIFSHGRSRILSWMNIGYSAYMYHFAGCDNVWGVVDNLLANPWLCFDFTEMVPLQKLSVTVGGLVSGQNDRRQVGKYVFPGGAELVFDIKKWNVALQYRMYYGNDLMPYYDKKDGGDHKYGNMLYLGDPFYRMAGGGFGIYNRIDLYYEPHIADFVDLRVGITGHFHEKYSGCRQYFGLVFNLQKLLEKAFKN